MIIRREQNKDIEAIRRVNQEAFARLGEADLVDALRSNNRVALSLVAEEAGEVVGHILCSPVEIQSEGAATLAVGLGPMAVLPSHQRKGIGSKLVRQGLEQLKAQGHMAVILLGHPDFYPKFGFQPASTFGITSQYDVPDEVFMAVELEQGALESRGGLVVYPDEFNNV